MKNLANILNIETLKAETEISIKRGKSTWEFNIPVDYVEFMSILWWELIYALHPCRKYEGLYVWKKEWRTDLKCWEFQIELLEDSWHGGAQVRFYKDKVVFLPFNAAFDYEFTPTGEGIKMTFFGSRNAFAQQWIVPETIHDLWKEVDNDWSRADFMWDAKGDRFSQAEFLAFYNKVDAEEFPHR